MSNGPDRLEEMFAGLPPHLQIKQLAEVLGVSRQTAYNYLTRGVVPAYRLEGAWVILRDEVKDYMRARSNQAPDWTPPAGERTD